MTVYLLSLALKLQHAIQQNRHECLPLRYVHLFDFQAAVCDDVDLFSFQSFFSLNRIFQRKRHEKSAIRFSVMKTYYAFQVQPSDCALGTRACAFLFGIIILGLTLCIRTNLL